MRCAPPALRTRGLNAADGLAILPDPMLGQAT